MRALKAAGNLAPGTQLKPVPETSKRVVKDKDDPNITAHDIIEAPGSEYTRVLQFAEIFRVRLLRARNMITSNTQKLVYMQFAMESLGR